MEAHNLDAELEAAYENEAQRNPFSFRVWWVYLKAKKNAAFGDRSSIYERALKVLPRSYKLWWHFLQEHVEHVKDDCPTSASWEAVNANFERALIHLSKMPVIWLDYTKFLWRQRLITRTRRSFDRALRSLPITQHTRIWEPYLSFVREAGVKETAIAVFRRYLMVNYESSELFINYLISIGHYDEAAVLLSKLVIDDDFNSSEGKTHHQLWLDLCDLVSRHPREITSLEVEPILRSGLKRFTDEVGRLWCALASHYIRLGLLEKARDVYEEALRDVATVRDFGLVFDAYSKFEEALIEAALKEKGESTSRPSKAVDVEETTEELTEAALMEEAWKRITVEEIDLECARLERLLNRRGELLSSVKLRQNPHNVHEWMNRAKLFAEDPNRVIKTFTEAVLTVDPQKAIGRLCVLWLKFARFYEAHEDFVNARKVLEKGTAVPFRNVDDLATIWCGWVEMELRNGNHADALEVARRSVLKRPGPRDAGPPTAQQKISRSVRLWGLCADLEESFGTLATVRAVYDKMFEIKVITPRLALRYAEILQENLFFEESFRIYERSAAVFKWPHLYAIWMTYLSKFVTRYRTKKLERARELFEQAVSDVPPTYARRLFLLYAKLEEQFGLARHALRVYERAIKGVAREDKYDLTILYIAKTAQLLGLVKTRPIFEAAMDTLPENRVKDLALIFSGIEKGLGEVDRARAIFQHASQFCDPKKEPEYWNEWRSYEVAHGNEDTFRDMLRTRRAVQAQYIQVHFNSTEELLGEARAEPELDPMAAAEAAVREGERQEADDPSLHLPEPDDD